MGCLTTAHLHNCEAFHCPANYVKCPRSYCIPVHRVCDGTFDCPQRDDEIGCENQDGRCKGMYKCKKESRCLPGDMVCDGTVQCEGGDDELMCDVICPPQCICLGYHYFCPNASFSSIQRFSSEAISLILPQNNLTLRPSMFSNFWKLAELDLSSNHLVAIPPGSFLGLENILHLNLKDNDIRMIQSKAFLGLKQIKSVELQGNTLLAHIMPDAFQGCENLPKLDLNKLALKTLKRGAFNGLESLKVLNLSKNSIATIEVDIFADIPTLVDLDLSDNPLGTYPQNMLTGLSKLEYVRSDKYAVCCITPPSVKPGNCQPQANAFSSCEDLMRNNVLRVGLWTLGCMALLGNLFVVLWRFIRRGTENKVQNLLVANLGIADFLMGAYLIIIASADAVFRGNYFMHDEKWRFGPVCNLAGVLATVSSEMSVVTLMTIACDRFMVIMFPFSDNRLNFKSACIFLLLSWTTFALLAIIPLFPIPYFIGGFYSRAPVCLAFHLTTERSVGMEYSVAIFTVFNFIAFLIIFMCYIVINVNVSLSSARAGKSGRGEGKLAVNTALIVMTDFCCWVPVMILSILALHGISIPGMYCFALNYSVLV